MKRARWYFSYSFWNEWPAAVILPAALALLFLAALLPRAAKAASDGLLVYVGTYTDTDSRGIYRLRFDDASGRLTPDGIAAETESPSFLATSADRRLLFAVNETSRFEGAPSGGVSAYALDPVTGALTLRNRQASGGTSPCHLTLDRRGRFLLVANYGGSAAVLPVAADGRLSPVVSRVDPKGRGPTARQDGSHAHGVYLDLAERRLLVPDLGLDQVLVYRFDGERGSLAPSDLPHASLAPGAGPRHLALSADGRLVHSVNELDSTVTTFTYDEATGRLDRRGTVSTLPPDFKGESYTAEIAVHPSGRFVYASNRGHDSIAVFAATGDTLTRQAVVPAGGRRPRHFAIAPSGRWLLVAHQDSGTIAVFRLDPATGALVPAGEPAAVPRPVCILFVTTRG
jgi:6-phosphogluconolactonase